MIEVMDGLTSRFATFEALEASIDDPSMLAAHVRSSADLAQTPWAIDRGLTSEVAPGLRIPAAPWQSDGATIGSPQAVAALGADNREVLAEIGFTDHDVDALVAAGALRS
jgi:crotonobetainyl-CoA:carnitine CoA-transferase CaiB-like acyl-CoA transferase